MKIEFNDDQVALLVDLLERTAGDVGTFRELRKARYADTGMIQEAGYAGAALLQTEYRLEEISKTIQDQSGHKWVHNDVTQRMEPRYKAREE
tara:strand:- start:228 stop:503 length:276 start_codon:yes stop_codon:yes gene_type:complete